mmetsp:Transcript_1804/g.4208  ORF Transcript_1804/g.4208 Transcript_1804/m.4208 type:complete len:121 (-) Transcript_1804:1717-2079(-)
MGLNTDISNSKKAAVGAEMTIASMKEERGTADYCGFTELRVVCAAADEFRMSAAADVTVTTSLAIHSKVAMGLWYEYLLGRVAEQRCICCMMHSEQSILRLLLGLCIGSSRMTNNATSAQ